MANIEEKVTLLLEPIITNLNYELYDIEYAKEGKNYYLRIFIDSSKGIDLNDCEKVNDAITDILDKADYIKEQYFLEVSSSGVERVLRKDKHLKQNIGKKVSAKLFKKDKNGKKEYNGELKSFDKDNITLEINKAEQNIERKNIAQLKTIFDWEL